MAQHNPTPPSKLYGGVGVFLRFVLPSQSHGRIARWRQQQNISHPCSACWRYHPTYNLLGFSAARVPKFIPSRPAQGCVRLGCGRNLPRLRFGRHQSWVLALVEATARQSRCMLVATDTSIGMCRMFETQATQKACVLRLFRAVQAQNTRDSRVFYAVPGLYMGRPYELHGQAFGRSGSRFRSLIFYEDH